MFELGVVRRNITRADRASADALAAFGSATGSPPSVVATVPEPSTCGLVILIAARLLAPARFTR